MKLLYKPFGIVAGVVGAKLGQNVFKTLWGQIDESDEPPRPKTRDASLGKVVAASALEAATLAGVAALIDRLGMRWFHYLTGIWPGDQPEDVTDDDASSPS
jgi:hypothetical protein